MKDQNNDKNAKAGYVPDTVHSSKYRSYKKKIGNNNSLNGKAANFKGWDFT